MRLVQTMLWATTALTTMVALALIWGVLSPGPCWPGSNLKLRGAGGGARVVVNEDRRTINMDFSEALKIVKAGGRVARAGWNGKGMFIFLVPGSRFTVNREPLLSILGEGTAVDYHGHVDMRTATGEIVPWLVSQTDLLADDWHQL